MSSVEYTEEKILTLIREKTLENTFLDYKSADALGKKDKNRNEISRDVSAFANSAGGDIIYGITEDAHIPNEIDGTTGILEKKTWLEQIINSNIQPRINGISVYPVLIPSQGNGAVLIVHIPKSHTAHQAKDQKYWCRYGSEKQAMEDYQVRQTMNRMRTPVLQFILEEMEIADLTRLAELSQSDKTLEMYLINSGVISAKEWEFSFHFPREILDMRQGSWLEDNQPSLRILGTKKWRIDEFDSQSVVIHPGQRYALSSRHERNRFVLAFQREYEGWNKTLPGYYEIYAENMSPKYGIINFIFADGSFKIQTSSMDSLPFIEN